MSQQPASGINYEKLMDPTAGYSSTEKVFDSIEKLFMALYMNSPVKRFVGTASIITLGMYFTKPAISFDQNGNARPAAFPNPNVPGATPLPFYLPGVLLGLFTAVFI